MVVKYLRKQLKRYVGKMVGVLSRKNVEIFFNHRVESVVKIYGVAFAKIGLRFKIGFIDLFIFRE